jgi:hypothetical protein
MSDKDKKLDVEQASLGPATRDDENAATKEEVGSTEGIAIMEEPEILRGMTTEQKLELEKTMKRKIDMRLLPMILILYILNYIDRWVLSLGQPFLRFPVNGQERKRRLCMWSTIFEMTESDPIQEQHGGRCSCGP